MANPKQDKQGKLIKSPGFLVQESLRNACEKVGGSQDETTTVLCRLHCNGENVGTQNAIGNLQRHLEVSFMGGRRSLFDGVARGWQCMRDL